MPPDPKLPEEFAPTGPKLTRFQMRPAPPVRPHLFPDEARFALRLAVLAGATELAAWAWLLTAGRRRLVLLLAALRLLRPVWAKAGTRVARPLLAGGLVALALAAFGAAFVSREALLPLAAVAAAVPALGDLCASCIADGVTVERRAAAYTWLDMAQALGAAIAISFTVARPAGAVMAASIALIVGCVGLAQLRDRGTPRSNWPLSAYASAIRTPLVAQLAALAFACGLLARWRIDTPTWIFAVLPLAGMVAATRLESRAPNAVWLPRWAAVVALCSALSGSAAFGALALGVMLAAIPASVARGAGEMERPLASSWAFAALFAGAAVGAVLGS